MLLSYQKLILRQKRKVNLHYEFMRIGLRGQLPELFSNVNTNTKLGALGALKHQEPTVFVSSTF